MQYGELYKEINIILGMSFAVILGSVSNLFNT